MMQVRPKAGGADGKRTSHWMGGRTACGAGAQCCNGRRCGKCPRTRSPSSGGRALQKRGPSVDSRLTTHRNPHQTLRQPNKPRASLPAALHTTGCWSAPPRAQSAMKPLLGWRYKRVARILHSGCHGPRYTNPSKIKKYINKLQS